MKATVSVPQLIVIIVIVVVLVFIATYASITIGGSGGTVNPSTPTPVAEVLEFRERKASTGLNQAGYFDSEIHQPGHYDFWFENKTEKPVRVRLQSVGCKCTTVETVLLPDEARNESKDQLDARAKAGLEWKELARDGSKSLPVPARAMGGIRLNWKGERLGADTVRAEILIEGAGNVQSVPLEVPVRYSDAIRVTADGYTEEAGRPENEAQLGTLLTGDTRRVKFLAWSSSRPDFKLTLNPSGDPCVTFSDAVKLTEEECKQLGEARGTKALCGYRFDVTVAERTEDGQPMDLGFFRRRIGLESEDAKAEAVVSGTVAGEIVLGVAADRNALNLGNFPAREGKTKTLELGTEKSGLDLEVATISDLRDRKDRPLPYPDFVQPPVLKDETMEQGLTSGKAWKLTVTVPPNAWSGPIPRDSAVYLKIKGEKPRFIRIPILGNAFVR